VMDETFDYAKDQMFSNIWIGHEPDSHESTQCALWIFEKKKKNVSPFLL
jgi:hypothetical protein